MRQGLAIALLWAAAWVGAGCFGIELEDVSAERAPGGMLRTEARVPVGAVAELEELQIRSPETQTTGPLTEDGLFVLPYGGSFLENDWWDLNGTRWARRLGTLLRGSDLFRTRAPERVQISLRATVVSFPENEANWRMLGVIPPFYFLLAFYADCTPSFAMESELECRSPDGDLLARYQTRTEIQVSAQVDVDMRQSATLTKTLDMAYGHATRVLVGKLLADTKLHERLRALGRVTAQAPKPPPSGAGGARPAGRTGAGAATAAAAAQPAPPRSPGATYVLVVGVDATSDPAIPKLRFAEADARDVYRFFATDSRSPTQRDRVELLLGKKATRLGILRALREHLVAKAARPEDTAILYFAGHGFADAKKTYLAGSDADLSMLPETAIPGATLARYWAEVTAGRKVVFMDACHSGGLKGLRGIGGVRTAALAAPTQAGGATLTVAASGPNELSTEDETLGHGVFTVALLNGLQGAADRNGDKLVTGAELASFLQARVPVLATQAKGHQTPVIQRTHAPSIRLSR